MRGNVEHVRRRLDSLRAAMTGRSPSDIEETLSALAQAIAAMEQTQQRLAQGEMPDRGLASALTALAREIGLVQQLADYGLALYRNRARELAAQAGGYAATGLPAPLPTGATIRIEG
jgi:hypothetical protein